jgi:four helix bundle protein
MTKHLFGFEKLDVWQKARLFVKDVYCITKAFPAEERFALIQQIQRATISIVSNIAEGTSRSSLKDQIRFIEMAYGSLMEVYCQFLIAKDLEYINETQLEQLRLAIDEISNKLNALRNSQYKRLNTQQS